MVAKVFIDIDMRLGLNGLSEYLKDKRIKVESHAMVMFLNRRKNQVKIMWASKYVLSFRKDSGFITIDELKEIPSYFREALFSSRTLENQVIGHLKESLSVELSEKGLKVS